MTDKVISLAPKPPGDKETADYFRDLADRIEEGSITEIVVAFNDKSEKCFERFGYWEDRWRLLGAIEYAKAHIGEA